MRNFQSAEVPTVELIVEYDNGPVDMNGMMDNLEERIANIEMVFAYLNNKKMLERHENKPKKVRTLQNLKLHLNQQVLPPSQKRDDISSTEFTIYEMMKGSSVWSVRYLVNIVQLLNQLPKGWSIRIGVWSICLGEGEENAFVVINLSGKVVKYNLISNTNTEIFDIGSNQMDDDDADDDDVVLFIPPFEVDPNLYEFIPSLASV
nr:hypothetical protein [Tanacetum cinerariifolium]